MSRRRLTLTATAALALSLAIPAQAADVGFRGLLELVAAGRGPAYDYNVLTRGDASFDAYGVRLFANARVNPKLELFGNLVLRDASAFYVDGAYLQFTPSADRDLHVLAGKVPWAVGTYAPRTYSNKNPLIGTPLMYQYHTTLVWYALPPNADALLATAGSGQYGVNYFGGTMSRGMVLVDDSYWDVGVTLNGSQRPLEYAVGITAGTPSWGSTSQDDNYGKSVLGRIGLTPLPGVRFGVSGAYGPYLVDDLKSQLPSGKSVSDYNQKLAMADLELLASHFELRGEAARNIWQTPTVGDLQVNSGYVELKYSLSFGAYLAGRLDAQRFGDITNSLGEKHTWDANVTRSETGVGYRFNRDVVAKLVYQHTKVDLESVPESDRGHDLMAAQVSVAF